MKRFEGKTVMITGAGGGIGYETMKCFAAEGADIIACGSKDCEEKRKIWNDVSTVYGVSVKPLFFDMSEDMPIKEAMKELQKQKKCIDILVNNAGVEAGGYLSMTGIDAIKRVFQVNYFAQLIVTQYVSKMMSRNKKGVIINIGSVMGIDSMAGGSAYGASKAALLYATRSLAKELAMFNIRVNAVAPNLIDTRMAHQMEQKSFDSMLNSCAMKRVGTPSEVAKTVLFLASDDASYITGQVLRIDGGM